MNDIAILLPTRNRPILLEKFIDSVYDTADYKYNIKIYIYVDDDDDLTKQSYNSLYKKYSTRINIFIGPRIIMSEMVNKLFPFTTEEIIFLGGDDLILKTPGWDSLIYSKFSEIKDKIALVFGDDTIQKDLATHPIIHRRWIECLGYVTPPFFSSDFADTWLTDIADQLGRKYKLPFINEHNHWTNGKAPMDVTYYENRIRFQRDNPEIIFNSMSEKRLEDIEKLRKLINEK